jgi:hypothetical protein
LWLDRLLLWRIGTLGQSRRVRDVPCSVLGFASVSVSLVGQSPK